MRCRHWPVLATILLATACATGGQGSTGRSPNVLTAADLADLTMTNAYDAVQRLRPRWLATRGPSTLAEGGNPVVVYIDNQRMGGVGELQNLMLHQVEEIRYLDASTATMRHGTGHASGAIEVTTKRR